MKDLRFKKPPFSPQDKEYNEFVAFKKWCEENNYMIIENDTECWAEPMSLPTEEEKNILKVIVLQNELNELKADIECTNLWQDTRTTWGKLPNTVYMNIESAKIRCRQIVTELRALKGK